jgi:hypothetical protein
MRILFFTNTLNFRGTTVSTIDYARNLREILGHEVVIGYYENIPYYTDGGTEDVVLTRIKREFEVRGARQGSIDSICYDIDFAYITRSGSVEEIPTVCPSGVHVVFQFNDPHGTVYAYISRWLSWKMSAGFTPYVPYIVSLPEPSRPPSQLRTALGIGQDKFIIGRLGGYTTFDIEFVKREIDRFAHEREDTVFLFLNTEPFSNNPNILYPNPVVDVDLKSQYLNLCDAFIHARSRGESFGMAVAEPLFFNKPVLSWRGGLDRNHEDILRHTDLLYTEESFRRKLLNIRDFRGNWKELVQDFEPKEVVLKFQSVFLKG